MQFTPKKIQNKKAYCNCVTFTIAIHRYSERRTTSDPELDNTLEEILIIPLTRIICH